MKDVRVTILTAVLIGFTGSCTSANGPEDVDGDAGDSNPSGDSTLVDSLQGGADVQGFSEIGSSLNCEGPIPSSVTGRWVAVDAFVEDPQLGEVDQGCVFIAWDQTLSPLEFYEGGRFVGQLVTDTQSYWSGCLPSTSVEWLIQSEICEGDCFGATGERDWGVASIVSGERLSIATRGYATVRGNGRDCSSCFACDASPEPGQDAIVEYRVVYERLGTP